METALAILLMIAYIAMVIILVGLGIIVFVVAVMAIKEFIEMW